MTTKGNAMRRLAAAAFALALTAGASFAENRALLVGIGHYETPGVELPGVDQDIKMMREVSLTLGFEPSQIRILSHSEATLDAIVGAIETWLVDGTTPADRALLYHSGHGTLVPDLDGDEADGNDEALLPYDFAAGAPDGGEAQPRRVLLDDDLGRLLERIPAREVVVLVDSCHSGTMTRAITRTEKFYPYPGMPPGKASSLMDRAESRRSRRDPVILLSAAAPEQEAQTSARGALFTRGIYQAVRRAEPSKYLTLEELRREAGEFIREAVGERTQLRHTPAFDGNPALRGLNLFLPAREPHERIAETPEDGATPAPAAEHEDLWNRLDLLVRGAGGDLSVHASKSVYRVGESLEISVVAPADGYLYVWNVGAGEKDLVLLYPNRYQSDNRVRAGQTVRIPDRGRFLLPARLPADRTRQPNLVAVIHTRSPLELPEDPAAPEETYAAGRMVVTIEN